MVYVRDRHEIPRDSVAIVGLATAIRIAQTGAAPNGELWAVQPVRIFHVLGPAAGR
jgi:hypothetical protein